MVAKNDVTGDSISTKLRNQSLYSKNFDKIFKKKKKSKSKKKS